MIYLIIMIMIIIIIMIMILIMILIMIMIMIIIIIITIVIMIEQTHKIIILQKYIQSKKDTHFVPVICDNRLENKTKKTLFSLSYSYYFQNYSTANLMIENSI